MEIDIEEETGLYASKHTEHSDTEHSCIEGETSLLLSQEHSRHSITDDLQSITGEMDDISKQSKNLHIITTTLSSRLVINLKPLNTSIRKEHFKMEGASMIKIFCSQGTGCTPSTSKTHI